MLSPHVRRFDRERVLGFIGVGVDGEYDRVADVRGGRLQGLPMKLQVRPQLVPDGLQTIANVEDRVLAHD